MKSLKKSKIIRKLIHVKEKVTMKFRFLKLTIFCISLALLSATVEAKAIAKEQLRVEKQCLSQSMVQLKFNLRKLWIDHVVWTRNYIVSAAAGMDDQQKVLTRLFSSRLDVAQQLLRVASHFLRTLPESAVGNMVEANVD
jgi:hypothetical protein